MMRMSFSMRTPPMPGDAVKQVVSDELQGLSLKFEDVFDNSALGKVIGSATIGQVHIAALKEDKTPVAVKVQHAGAEKTTNVV